MKNWVLVQAQIPVWLLHGYKNDFIIVLLFYETIRWICRFPSAR